MNIIIEGLDRCGKSTLISSLQGEIYSRWVSIDERHQTCNILHYSNIKSSTLTVEEMRTVSEEHYRNGFDLMIKNHRCDNVMIFDRFHLGEHVYSDMYRGYEGSYVFDIEADYLPVIQEDTYLIVLVDDPANLIARDDGESFTVDLEKKQWEVDRFIDAFEKSAIHKKTLLNINDLTIEDVAEKIKDWIF